MTRYDVFLSYNGADRDMVVAVAESLGKAGLRPFLDRWHLVPGRPFVPALEEALEASGAIAVFFGPTGVSGWQDEERQLALDLVLRARQRRRAVIPVILPGGRHADVDGFLRLRTWVDLADEDGFARLVAGIEGRAPGGPPHDASVTSSPPHGTEPSQGPSDAPSLAPSQSGGPTTATRSEQGLDQTTDDRGQTRAQKVIVHSTVTLGPPRVGRAALAPRMTAAASATERDPPKGQSPIREFDSIATRLADAYQRRDELSSIGEDTSDVTEEILDLRRQQRQGPTLHAGEFLGDGRFQLIKVIGQGGFAMVWKAQDRSTGRPVAVKVLHGQFVHADNRRERLFRGASRMAQLQHPNIVKVVVPEGEEQGFYYYVMEYVAGGDLHQAVLERRIDRERALAVVDAIAGALRVAHHHGLVHRDVKPQNILLHEDGRPVLSDFDLVHAKDTTGGTRTGALGTVLYAAPEQNEDAGTVDHRADIYSLGMTAVFCIYGGKLPRAVIYRREVFLKELACSEGVRQVLRRAVAEEPDDRFDSMASLRSALTDALRASREMTPIDRRAVRRWAFLVGVGAGVAIGTVGLAYWLDSNGEDERENPTGLAAPAQNDERAPDEADAVDPNDASSGESRYGSSSVSAGSSQDGDAGGTSDNASEPRTAADRAVEAVAESDLRPEPKPTPVLTPTEPTIDADTLLHEARTLQVIDPQTAYRKAKTAYVAKPSRDALWVMGFAACRLGDKAKAIYVLKRFKDDEKTKLRDHCAQKGLEI